MINLKKDFKFQKLELINFLNLDHTEKELVRQWRNDKNIRKWMYSNHIIPPNEHNKFINGLRNNDKNFFWLVKCKKKYVGVIYLNRVDFNHKNACLGIYSNPELSGAGNILMECLKKLAFGIIGLHTLKLEVIETNKHAINFYKKSCFKQEGRLKEFIHKDGSWLDVIMMGIISGKG